MKYESIILASASGSVGGCTYSSNRAGQYIRRRAKPVNPGSLFAQVITAAMASLVARWTQTLDTAQRSAWDAIAFGRSETGLNLYVKYNVLKIQFGFTVVDTAPIDATVAPLSPATFVGDIDEAGLQIEVNFLNTDPWATAVGGGLGVFVSRPQGQTINFFKGPYRLAGVVVGAVVPPTSPATFSVPFPIVENQKVFTQLRAIQADGRISGVMNFANIVIA